MLSRKEARGSPLFSYLNGVQVVVGSNPTTPTIKASRNGYKSGKVFILDGW